MITRVIITNYIRAESGEFEVHVEGDDPKGVAKAFLKAREILTKKDEKEEKG